MNEKKKKPTNQFIPKPKDEEVFITLAKSLYETVLELEKILDNRYRFFKQEIDETSKRLDHFKKP